jgi:hypothetical protein
MASKDHPPAHDDGSGAADAPPAAEGPRVGAKRRAAERASAGSGKKGRREPEETAEQAASRREQTALKAVGTAFEAAKARRADHEAAIGQAHRRAAKLAEAKARWAAVALVAGERGQTLPADLAEASASMVAQLAARQPPAVAEEGRRAFGELVAAYHDDAAPADALRRLKAACAAYVDAAAAVATAIVAGAEIDAASAAAAATAPTTTTAAIAAELRAAAAIHDVAHGVGGEEAAPEQ